MMTISEHGKHPRSKRFTILLTEQEDCAIRDYRFANRLPTQAEAARTLIKKALSQEIPASAGK